MCMVYFQRQEYQAVTFIHRFHEEKEHADNTAETRRAAFIFIFYWKKGKGAFGDSHYGSWVNGEPAVDARSTGAQAAAIDYEMNKRCDGRSLYMIPAGPCSLTLPVLGLLSSKAQGRKDFWKTSKPCHIGIHWKALFKHSQMSTICQGFINFFASFCIGQISHQPAYG